MYQLTFHGLDSDRDLLYHYSGARDQAIKTLGPRVLDSIVPGLSVNTLLQIKVLCLLTTFSHKVTKILTAVLILL